MSRHFRFGWLLGLLLGSLMLFGMLGCELGTPSGTLQVFYSGNLTGNLEPCG